MIYSCFLKNASLQLLIVKIVYIEYAESMKIILADPTVDDKCLNIRIISFVLCQTIILYV
jgi:hypothetical protein